MNRTCIAHLLPVLSLCLVVGKAPAEQLQLLDGRELQSLNGEWHYIVDPQSVGAVKHDGGKNSRGFFLDRQVNHDQQLQEYDFAAAPVMNVPGSWNAQRGELLHYEGVVWLQRRFEFEPGAAGRRHFLHFEAVNYRAVVYLNGVEVGVHEGGFTPFSIEVGEALQPGENSLVVQVDNRMSASTLPAERFDWWNYGGITREVFLIETPASFVKNFRLQLSPDQPEIASGWVQLEGGGDSVEVRIGDGDWHRFNSRQHGRIQLSLPAPAERWSTAKPALHRVELRAGEDEVADLIGFRTIEVSGSDILLNGEKIFLRGISVHEEKLDGSDRMATREDAEQTLEAIAALNANYARLTHYPHNRHMARVADEIGLLLWAEVPVYWDVDFNNPGVLSKASRSLTDLIQRDGNRASVIIWSVGNETPPGEARNRFLLSLFERVRSEDDTRLISAAAMAENDALQRYAGMLAAQLKGAALEPVLDVAITDPLEDVFDVISYNEYMGWYDAALLAEMLQAEQRELREASLGVIPRIRLRAASGKPLILSEFGAGAVRGREGGPLDVWTEAYQAKVYRAQLLMVEQSPEVSGISPWVFKDFRSPRRPLTGIQDYYNRKGILDERGQPKSAYQVLKKFYASQAR